jgi:hypothetical protein
VPQGFNLVKLNIHEIKRVRDAGGSESQSVFVAHEQVSCRKVIETESIKVASMAADKLEASVWLFVCSPADIGQLSSLGVSCDKIGLGGACCCFVDKSKRRNSRSA